MGYFRHVAFVRKRQTLPRGRERPEDGSQPCRDRLRFGVMLHNFFSHFTAPAGLLISAEWPSRIAIVMSIDADRARLDLAGHAVGNAQVPRPDACLKSVFGVIGEPGYRIEIIIVE